jgi:hypothetical protein
MDDHDIDTLLRNTGETFRSTHTRRATVTVRRPRPLLLPLVAAAATGLVIAGVAIVVPDRKSEPPVVPARPASIATEMAGVDAVAFNDEWLAVSGADHLGQDARGRIELRRRAALNRITATITTSYPYGNLRCLALDGDHLLWTDLESIVTDYAPGPPTRWSLWQRDLVSGEQRRLANGLPTDPTNGDSPCPVAGAGKVAWQLDGQVTVRDSAGGEVTVSEAASPVSLGPAGLVLVTYDRAGMHVALRSGPTYTSRREILTLPRGTDVAAGRDRLLTFSVDPENESNDAVFVSTGELPACSSLTELRRDPSSGRGVVGNGFAAWSHLEEGPAVVRFDGKEPPAVEPGYVSFLSLAAYEHTLAYGTQTNDAEGKPGPVVVHLLEITGDS